VLGGACFSDGSLNTQGGNGNYWSSTYNSEYDAYALYFYSSLTNPGTYNVNKYNGRPVRCVRNF
jgi:uncharacterized protein (TIGR02145 family)